jgi:hypothetical protein
MTRPNPNDFRVLPPNDEDLIPIYIGSDVSKPFWIKWKVLREILTPIIPSGTAAWGSIATGGGVASQTDLIAYLVANYYPLLSNPAGYVTATQLSTTLLGYVTTAALTAALANYVPTSRTLTINGVTFDLSADRSWTVSGGSAAWGSIGAGTGVGSQADLVAYLVANYYPLSGNPSGFITSAALTPYLTIVAAAAAYVPLSRTLTINGTSFDLSANRAWTISTTDYPYQRRTYYKAAQLLNLIRYNDLLYMVNASPTASGVLVVDRNTTETTNTVVLAGGLYNQLITITGTDEIWNTSTNTSIQRYTASTGVFIANTAITGVITTAISTRFIQFSSTKVFMANSTNYFALNSSFVTTSLTAHGVGNIPYMAVNNNVSSAQNGHVMMGSTNGIMLINGTTNAVALSVTTLGGVLGPVYDIQYDSTNDWWIVVTVVGGNQRVIYLRPLTTTTFTVIETITEFNSAGTALAVGTGFTARIVFDAVTNVLFVVCNGTVFQYILSTGELVKSFIYRFVGASGIIVSAEIDTTNKILYVASSVASQTLIHEFIYA